MSPADVPDDLVEKAAEVMHSRLYWAERITFAEAKATVAEALTAALDVEEMAREMVKHQRVAPYSERRCMCGVTVSSKETGAEHVATALRAAILGGAA